MDKTILISEKYHIEARLIRVGDDLCVILTGGDAPHIGAVSAGVFGPGVGAAHADLEKNAAEVESVFTYTYPAHRDNAMSEPLAKALSARLQKNVTVLCGIHIDNLPKEEIEAIVKLLPIAEEMIVNFS